MFNNYIYFVLKSVFWIFWFYPSTENGSTRRCSWPCTKCREQSRGDVQEHPRTEKRKYSYSTQRNSMDFQRYRDCDIPRTPAPRLPEWYQHIRIVTFEQNIAYDFDVGLLMYLSSLKLRFSLLFYLLYFFSFENEKSSLISFFPIQVNYELVSDFAHPGHFICKIADERSVDLVVMGTRGLGTHRKSVLGHVSSYVLHHAHCSVCLGGYWPVWSWLKHVTAWSVPE